MLGYTVISIIEETLYNTIIITRHKTHYSWGSPRINIGASVVHYLYK